MRVLQKAPVLGDQLNTGLDCGGIDEPVGSFGKASGSATAIEATAGVRFTVRKRRASWSSQALNVVANRIRPFSGSQASSYQVIAATASCSASEIAAVAFRLNRSGSAVHQ